MKLKFRAVSNAKTLTKVTIPNTKLWKSKSLKTQAEKEEQLVSNTPSVKKMSKILADSTEEISKKKLTK